MFQVSVKTYKERASEASSFLVIAIYHFLDQSRCMGIFLRDFYTNTVPRVYKGVTAQTLLTKF